MVRTKIIFVRPNSEFRRTILEFILMKIDWIAMKTELMATKRNGSVGDSAWPSQKTTLAWRQIQIFLVQQDWSD
jgi:hypothetical protein